MENIPLGLIFVMKLIYFSKCTEIIDQAALITNEVYTYEVLTSVVWGQYCRNDVTNFLTKFNGTVATIDIENENFNNTNFHKTVSYSQTVFFATDTYEFEYFLEIINKVIVLPIRVIMILSNENANTLDAFTEIAWKKDVGDIIILSSDVNNEIRVSTYMPYGDGACGNHTPIQLNIDEKIFFIGKYSNFHRCPIRLVVLDFVPYVEIIKENNTIAEIRGIDGNLLNLIVDKLNCSLDILKTLNLKDYSTVVKDLVYNDADIILPSLIMTNQRYSDLQVSYINNVLKVVWCLPNRREIYEWAKVLLPFFNLTTPFIMAAFLIVYMTIKLGRKFGRIIDRTRNDIVYIMMGLFFGQDINYDSRYWLINSLYMFWIWFCMIVRISYQGNLVEGLRKSILEPKPTTLNEAVETVEKVGGTSSLVDFYRNTTIEKKYVTMTVGNLPDFVNDIADGKRYMLATDIDLLMFYSQNLQILDERVTTVPTCIHMRPRWPAAPEISRVIAQLVESGFIVKIRIDIVAERLLRFGKNLKDTEPLKPMEIETIKSCFYGLIMMYLASTAVFIVEVLWHKYNAKNV